MIRQIAVDKWPRRGHPLLPMPYRSLWYSETLPDGLAEAAGLPLSTRLGDLDAEVWERAEPPARLVPGATFILQLATSRLYHGADDTASGHRIVAADRALPDDLGALPFSRRTRNALTRAGKEEDVDWLESATAEDILKLRGAGALSLLDFASVCETVAIPDGKPDDSRREITSIVERERRLLESNYPIGAMYTDDPRLPGWMHEGGRRSVRALIDDLVEHPNALDAGERFREIRSELEGLARETLKEELEHIVRCAIGDRHLSTILMRLGWDGQGVHTLQQCANVAGVSRERIRQLEKKVREVGSRVDYAPALDRAIEVLTSGAQELDPSPRTLLQRAGLASDLFAPDGVATAAEVLGREVAFVVGDPDGPLLLPTDSKVAEVVSSVLRGLTDVNHVAPLAEVQARVEQASGLVVEHAELRQLLDRSGSVVWLDTNQEWLWDGRETRYINMAKKILSVSDPIRLETLRTGVLRHHRTRNMSLSRDAFEGLCRAAGFKVVDSTVFAEPKISRSSALGQIESTMADVLEAAGDVIPIHDFRDTCVDRGVNNHSFWLYVSYSPILDRLAPGVYSLRGRTVDPATVASIAGRTVSTRPALQDHGWTKDGAIWLAYEVNRSIYDSGVVTVPSDVRRLLGEKRYELFAVDGSTMGTLAFASSNGWGLMPFINRRGVDIGDFIVVAVDTQLDVAIAMAGSPDLVVTYEEGEGWGPWHHLEAATEPDHAA